MTNKLWYKKGEWRISTPCDGKKHELITVIHEEVDGIPSKFESHCVICKTKISGFLKRTLDK